MKVLLYCHGGSDNRGCEAIVRTTADIIKTNGYKGEVDVFTAHPEEDLAVEMDKVVQLKKNPTRSIPELSIFQRGVAKIYDKLFKTEKIYYKFTDIPFCKYDFKDTIALSIGGDHYCYFGGEEQLALHNLEVKKKGGISVLWGCSVEPDMMKNVAVVEDMKLYDLITARESITYNALKAAGVENVTLYPDPAFTLDYENNKFSEQLSDNTVGINISTYAEGESGIGMKNYVRLINRILEETDMDICLIPHVFKSHTNDMLINSKLFSQLSDTSRVIVIDEKLTAMQLKAVIRKCRFYIGARTHSTIAAYSSCVPTLVLGYSVKAKGIAKDIFGTHKNYVVSVHDLKSENELADAFWWLKDNEDKIRTHLVNFMPEYIEKSHSAGKEIAKFLEK
ncbi:MAG: polysaccharide pyruvyl transferase family protein [Ruminococcus sp.]|nr:polysaccharide pyruvyl transferase family protein [Ruminococcus sp.]